MAQPGAPLEAHAGRSGEELSWPQIYSAHRAPEVRRIEPERNGAPTPARIRDYT